MIINKIYKAKWSNGQWFLGLHERVVEFNSNFSSSAKFDFIFMSIQRVSVLPRIIVNALEYFSIDPRVWVVLDLYRVRRTWSSRAPLNSLLSNQCHAYRHMYSWLHLQIKASVFIHIWILKSCDLDVWRKPERLFIQWRSGSTPETPILTYRSRSHNRLTLKPSPMKFSSSGNFKATATISNIFFLV